MVSEEVSLIGQLAAGVLSDEFHDDLHRRLSGAIIDPAASGLDRAVLVRQLLRRWSLRDDRRVPVDLTEKLSAEIRKAAALVDLRESGRNRWFAESWRPKWLNCERGEPDAAALAGTDAGERFAEEKLKADPFFTRIAGYATYRTAGQRAACRAVMSTPEGSTIIAMLPTGSGKTEIALCLSERRTHTVTVIVVPTVALAYDFERRFRDHFVRRNTRLKADQLHFAWTATTDEGTREAIRRRVRQGQQPLLITSPESMTRALRQTLLESAAGGRLQGFVIDEAHLVTQWGRDFRPEFRTLADLRRDLLAKALENGHDRPVTLLLSATLGAVELEDLLSLFGKPGPCSPIIANALRCEPDTWIGHAQTADERDAWVLETLAHTARPAILYVTSPKVAEGWMDRLRTAGYSRIASVTGATAAQERVRVLDALRARPGRDRTVDLVVATSAFGLGIDYAHVRTVIHACLPETVDRWYQELGRGGRDGNVCAEFLLTAPEDKKEAESLGATVLTPETAKDRWRDLWWHRRETEGSAFVDLEGSRGVGRGDYNRRWNAQLVQGLVELDDLRREQFDVEQIRHLLDDDSVDAADWTAVSLASSRLGADDYWSTVWGPWQQRESNRSRQALERILDVSKLKVGACTGIALAYEPSERLKAEWGPLIQWMQPQVPCGRCPHCRMAGRRVATDPPPHPVQTWTTNGANQGDLVDFVSAAHGTNGVALLTYRTGEEVLASSIARGLVERGVRHLGGVDSFIGDPPGEVMFVDEQPLAPGDLTPVASFSFFSTEDAISRWWLSRRQKPRFDSDRNLVVDVLLVPTGARIGGREVGRELPSIAGSSAVELLGRK
ncbi:DEAD-box ATP-dependent RNA helicase CshB [Rhodococcus ruber]|uniref:protein DpdF n=1 Tax=Rhodococcus ruber TaxID=1830 RepID=UPI00315DAB28